MNVATEMSMFENLLKTWKRAGSVPRILTERLGERVFVVSKQVTVQSRASPSSLGTVLICTFGAGWRPPEGKE